METFVYALHFIACFVLVGVVLLQRGKGADLGASLGGGSANTMFGSRGAGNFLTKITTASAVTFMATSLTLSYYGYQSSDIQLFDGSENYEIPIDSDTGGSPGAGGLVEIPSAGNEAGGGLVEIETGDAAVADETTPAEE
jgi:preprotein translocase subunit SecG